MCAKALEVVAKGAAKIRGVVVRGSLFNKGFEKDRTFNVFFRNIEPKVTNAEFLEFCG
jgi:hypothetical protein